MIPPNIMQKTGLIDENDAEARPEEGQAAIKALTSRAQFIKDLKGCIEGSNIDPLEVKNFWTDNRTKRP